MHMNVGIIIEGGRSLNLGSAMLYIGLIKNQNPSSLTDPRHFESVEELHHYLTQAINQDGLISFNVLTLKLLQESILAGQTLIVSFGHPYLSLMIGEEDSIYSDTTSFKYISLTQM